jgi:hypothetical protein
MSARKRKVDIPFRVQEGIGTLICLRFFWIFPLKISLESLIPKIDGESSKPLKN